VYYVWKEGSMKRINGATNYRLNRRDSELFYETDKIDKALMEHFNIANDLWRDQHYGLNNPLRRQKWKAHDTYWKDLEDVE
jgi:hypothetical protein